MLKAVEPRLGRYLVSELDLDMGASRPRLIFKVAFRGDDFRARMAVLQRAITDEAAKADSPFLPPTSPTPPEKLFSDRSETGVTGAYFKFEIPIKDSFQAFGPSTTFGSLARPRLQQELLAQGPGAGEVGR